MTIQLLNQGHPLLTATTEHKKGQSTDSLPVKYEGDFALLPRAPEITAVSHLVGIFQKAASVHGLALSGDYRDYEIRTTLVLDDEVE